MGRVEQVEKQPRAIGPLRLANPGKNVLALACSPGRRVRTCQVCASCVRGVSYVPQCPCVACSNVVHRMRLEGGSAGLNHVTGPRSASALSAARRRRRHRRRISGRDVLTGRESQRPAVPSRRAVRNTSCVEFETIISRGSR